MASSGPSNSSSVAAAGFWASAANATGAANGTVASGIVDPAEVPSSGYLVLAGFGFSVPAGATINGITGSVTSRGTGAAATFSARLYNGATGVGTAKTFTPAGSLAAASLGGSTDVWGATLTEAIVNGSFGLGLKVDAIGGSSTWDVDSVSLTVDYTAAGGGSGSQTSRVSVGSEVGI